MRITAASGFVLFLALVAPVFAAPAQAPSFLGEWTATAETPAGKVSETLSVAKTEKGYAITAKLVGADENTPTAGPGTDIVLEGDRFSYKRSIPTPGGPVVLTYAGVVSGDTFKGTADLAGFAVPYTCVRTKAQSSEGRKGRE